MKATTKALLLLVLASPATAQVFDNQEDRRAVLCGIVGRVYESAVAERNKGAPRDSVERSLVRFFHGQFPEIDESFIEDVADSVFDDPWFAARPFVAREMSGRCMAGQIPSLNFSGNNDLLTGGRRPMSNQQRCFYLSGMIGFADRWKINGVPLYRAQKRMIYAVVESGTNSNDAEKWSVIVSDIYTGKVNAAALSSDLRKVCEQP